MSRNGHDFLFSCARKIKNEIKQEFETIQTKRKKVAQEIHERCFQEVRVPDEPLASVQRLGRTQAQKPFRTQGAPKCLWGQLLS